MSPLGKFLAFIINALLGARIWWLSFDYFEGMGAAALGPGMLLMVGMPAFVIGYALALSFFQEYLWKSYAKKKFSDVLLLIPVLAFLGYMGMRELPTRYAHSETYWTSFLILSIITVGSFSLFAIRLAYHSFAKPKAKRKNAFI
jgi:hypothetical protein